MSISIFKTTFDILTYEQYAQLLLLNEMPNYINLLIVNITII